MPFPDAVLVVALAAPLVFAGERAVPAKEMERAYLEIVERYRSGDQHRAVQEVLAWHPGLLYAVTAKIRAPLPAAVMLHTHAGLVLRWGNDPIGASAQW